MKISRIIDHIILLIGVIILMLPLWLIFVSSTHSAQDIARNGVQFWFGDNGFDAYKNILFGERGEGQSLLDGMTMLKNAIILGLGFAIGKIIVSMMAAYAIVYFRFPFGNFLFWIIFSSLLMPLEVRIIPSYEIVAKLNLVNTYTGLILPLIASATATFFFRQFFKSVPEELIEAARLDNAGPFRFFY